MEQLVSASLGIFKLGNFYYAQVITADKYNFFYFKIGAAQAQLLSEAEGLEIEPVEQLPYGVILNEDNDILYVE